jgi:hypothetical protein
MILLIGADVALLEGLSQSLAALGYHSRTASGLREAIELAAPQPPLIAVIDRSLAMNVSGDILALPLALGGALVLYHAPASAPTLLAPSLQRVVLADLALPLERHRLITLVQHVAERARLTGRQVRRTSPEQLAP